MSHTKTLNHSFLPELGMPRHGKVREIYEKEDTLALISSDRISVFDRILPHPIQDKGRVLTKLSHFWFEKTKDLVANHVISHPDPNVLIVKKCQPIMIEVIVRGYLAGSLARDYQAGKRKKCGIILPEGLQLNDPLHSVLVTPTTKSLHGHDEDITKEELISQGLVTPELWNKIEKTALQLYARGQEIVGAKGLILVDTKYEFGLDKEGRLTLIDEIHTPDSSRFWFKNDYANKQVRYPDKEFVREWMRSQGFIGEGAVPDLPQDVRDKASRSYREIYEIITGDKLPEEHEPVAKRLLKHLKQASIIKGMHALIISGSEKDQAHVDKIAGGLTEEGIPFHQYVASAHKHPKRVFELLEQYNESLEPLVCITVAGRSNALSGVVAANLKWPVIACPPFKDYSDYLANIHSTLQMPSQVPSMTVIDPSNAALAAAKILKTMEMAS
jgi:phosphoribosylaminoimidazole-succinocarboxamide synthase